MQQIIEKNNRYISLQETVALLGVSSATIKNWIKHGYLAPEKNLSKELFFDYGRIRNLQKKILLSLIWKTI